MIRNYLCLVLFIFSFTSAAAQNKAETEEKIRTGIELLNRKKHRESLELLTHALEEATSRQWQRERYLSLNNIGSNYYGLGDLNEAIRYYLLAFDVAEKHLDAKAQMAGINNIAVVYFQDREFEKAFQYFEKARLLAKNSGETGKQGLYALNLALVSNKMNRLREAETYLREAEKHLSENPDYTNRIRLAQGEFLIKNGEAEKAFQMLSNLPETVSEQNREDDYMLQQILLAEIYAEKKDYKKAIHHALLSRSATTGRENLINAFIVLSRYYEKDKNYPAALAYKDSVILHNDELFRKKTDTDFQVNKIKFELLDSQQQLRESRLESVKNKILFYSILVFSFLITGIFILIFKNYRKNQHQQKMLSDLELAKKKNENQLLEQQLQEKKMLSLLEKERYKTQMDSKNREILGKAFVQASQQEAINNLVTQVENHPNPEKWNTLKKEVESLKRTFDQTGHWESFFLHFEETNPEYIQRLTGKHPELNQNEIRFITYLYINLSNKEIATLLGISADSVRKRKERLAKKLNLDSSRKLYAYLLGI